MSRNHQGRRGTTADIGDNLLSSLTVFGCSLTAVDVETGPISDVDQSQPWSNIIIVYCKHITRTRTRKSPLRLSLFDGSLASNCDAFNAPLFKGSLAINGRSLGSLKQTYKKCLGRTEMRILERKCFRARITTCSLRTSTD